MAIITNPSFETGTGQTATGWTYSETANFDDGAGESRRGDWTAWLALIGAEALQNSSNGFLLGQKTGSLTNFVAGVSYCQIAQSVDMTRIAAFQFNAAWGTVINGAPRFQFDVLVDTDALFSKDDDDAAVDPTWPDTQIDLSSYTGTHDLIFRLKAVETVQSQSCGIFIDHIRENLLPDQVTLTAPTDAALHQDSPLTLDWEAAEDATTYDVQVSTGSGFTSNIVDQTGIADTYYATSALSSGTLYYWRVRGVNAVGNGEWSDTWSFRMRYSSSGAGYFRDGIIIAYRPTLEEDDPIHIVLDNGDVHATRIADINHVVGVETRIKTAEKLPSATSIGNKVLLPSINSERWA